MIDSLIFYFNFNFPLEYTMKRYSKEENYNKERIVCHLKFIIHTWCVNRRETIVQFAGSYKIECCINVQPSVSQEYSVNGLILPNLKDPVFVVVTAQLQYTFRLLTLLISLSSRFITTTRVYHNGGETRSRIRKAR